ncbi:MAG: PAS domain S-box protein [Bacteroidales bacterium]
MRSLLVRVILQQIIIAVLLIIIVISSTIVFLNSYDKIFANGLSGISILPPLLGILSLIVIIRVLFFLFRIKRFTKKISHSESIQTIKKIINNESQISIPIINSLLDKQEQYFNKKIKNDKIKLEKNIEKLKTKNKIFADILNHIPSACCIINNNLEIESINEKAKHILLQKSNKNNPLQNLKKSKYFNSYETVLNEGSSFYLSKINFEMDKKNTEASLNAFRSENQLVIIIHDISKQNRTEQKLIESQINLKRAQKISRIGNWEWNMQTNFITLSEETFDILGITKTINLSIRLNTILEHVHSADKESFINGKKKAVNKGQNYSDFRFIRPEDGREIFIHSIWENSVENKHITRFGILQDITQFKLTEMKLEEVRQRFNLLVNSIDEVFWITDPDIKHFYYISPAVNRIWPFSIKELIENPKALATTIIEEDRERVLNSLKNTLKNNGYNEVYRIRMKDGKIKWLHGIGLPVPHPVTGEPRVVGTTRDISFLKEKENEQLQLAAAVDQSSEGIIISNLKGKITYTNQAFIKISGFTREETIGKSMIFFTDKNENKVTFRHFFSHINSGVIWNGKIIGRKKNGEKFPMEFTVSPIKDPEGQIINFLTMISDITKQEALETQIRQAQKMETIGTLTSGIAHDFNNILATIQGYLHFAFEDLEKDHPIRPNLDQIMKASVRATNLVKQILNFTRKSKEEFISININSIIEDTLSLMRSSIPINIKVEFKNDDSEEFLISGEPTQLHQVILNLLTNSIYAMKDIHGVISIFTEYFKPNEEFLEINTSFKQSSYVKISIKDEGVGMDPKTIDKIFDPFFTTKPVDEGTGLGLSVVHGIINNHLGIIMVKSEENKGTNFDIYLPLISPLNHEKKILKLKEHLNGKKIIIILSDIGSSIHISKTLSESGAEVIEFLSQEPAIQYLHKEAESCDLIITDQISEQFNGLSIILEGMKINNNLNGILIPKEISEDLLQIKKNHNIHLITKPFSFEKIEEKILNIFKKNEHK